MCACTTAVGVPAHTARKPMKLKIDLDHTDLPDPIAIKINELEKELKPLKNHYLFSQRGLKNPVDYW